MVVALLSSLLSIPQGLDAAQRKAGNDASAMVPENGVHKVPLLKLDQTMRIRTLRWQNRTSVFSRARFINAAAKQAHAGAPGTIGTRERAAARTRARPPHGAQRHASGGSSHSPNGKTILSKFSNSSFFSYSLSAFATAVGCVGSGLVSASSDGEGDDGLLPARDGTSTPLRNAEEDIFEIDERL